MEIYIIHSLYYSLTYVILLSRGKYIQFQFYFLFFTLKWIHLTFKAHFISSASVSFQPWPTLHLLLSDSSPREFLTGAFQSRGLPGVWVILTLLTHLLHMVQLDWTGIFRSWLRLPTFSSNFSVTSLHLLQV